MKVLLHSESDVFLNSRCFFIVYFFILFYFIYLFYFFFFLRWSIIYLRVVSVTERFGGWVQVRAEDYSRF